MRKCTGGYSNINKSIQMHNPEPNPLYYQTIFSNFFFFIIFLIGIKIEDWLVMGRQRFSNLRNRYMIKILMLRIQE